MKNVLFIVFVILICVSFSKCCESVEPIEPIKATTTGDVTIGTTIGGNLSIISDSIIYNNKEFEICIDKGENRIDSVQYFFDKKNIGMKIGEPYCLKYIPVGFEPGAYQVEAKVYMTENTEVKTKSLSKSVVLEK